MSFSSRCCLFAASRPLLAPQRSLSMATAVAESDGPFRSLRFRLKPIRHDFQNVLVHADTNKLIATAHELLEHAHVRKSASFWDIYRKRVVLTHTCFSALETAVILRAFDVHKQDKGIYRTIANTMSSGITTTTTTRTGNSSSGSSSSGSSSGSSSSGSTSSGRSGSSGASGRSGSSSSSGSSGGSGSSIGGVINR
eukprot:GHVS01018599.1.p2 GENE.GHVS01018599.1~~GHVS01018599.1.p2  ORF type:complete len:196 (+),score=105.41 GHVS01018599.1:101-688(+)